MPARIPCINPSCRRTGNPEKFAAGTDSMICRKCFNALPVSYRRRFKAYWKRDRQIWRWRLRKSMASRQAELDRIEERHHRLGQKLWNDIIDFFRPSTRPEGLDAFLEEMNLK